MCKKILLVEDEKELSKAVGTILKMNGYSVTCKYNGKEALDETKSNLYDCIVMDIMMPVMDGIESLKSMRKIGVKTPVILLTAKSQVEDKVESLDSGANDYLTKPFSTKELLARIRALTRVSDEENKQIKFGNLVYNKETNKISNENASLILSENESRIMDIFVSNPNTKISLEDINSRALNNNGQANMYVNLIQEKLKALNGNMKIEKMENYFSLNLSK